MAKVYAACAFSDKPGAKTYDYLVNIDGIKVGDKVRVPSQHGLKTVHVVALKDETTVSAEYLKEVVEVVNEEEAKENGE